MVSLNEKNFKDIAKNVIELEIQALKKLKGSINNSFNQAVNIIAKCQSKIIFCGVGKSSKISANLAQLFHPLEVHHLHCLLMMLLMVI